MEINQTHISRLNETKRLGLNRSPGQVRCMKQGTQSQSTGTMLRDGMGREVAVGFRMGTHGHSWLIHVDVWQKPLQYCKVISLQLK